VTFFAGEILTAEGLNAARIRVEVQRFESSGTWNKPDDEDFAGAFVEIQAGGGGSGGCAATAAGQTSGSGGGQGGAYARFWVPAADLGASETVTVGTGGAGGASGNNAGSDGADSSFGGHGNVDGGEGGAGGGAAASSGASSTQNGGDQAQAFTGTASNVVFIRGGDGGVGYRINNSQGVIPGYGGGSALGAARAITGLSSGQISASAGKLYGGGASGPANTESESAQAGAAGAAGLVMVTEVYG
jgi:hypothetical protein